MPNNSQLYHFKKPHQVNFQRIIFFFFFSKVESYNFGVKARLHETPMLSACVTFRNQDAQIVLCNYKVFLVAMWLSVKTG